MKNEITAKRLRLALSNANIKPQELANKSGVSKASISQYLNGSHAPSNISSGKMGKILNVNPMWLMGFDVAMKNEDSPMDQEFKNTISNPQIKTIIEKANLLSTQGLSKLNEYADDLVSSGKYDKIKVQETAI